MSTSSHAPFYDLFKLIVAIILLLIFLFLLRISPGASPESISSISTPTPVPPTETITSTPSAIPVTPSPTQTSTSIPSTNTPVPVDTPTQTSAPSQPTETPVPETSTSPTPAVESPSDSEMCGLAPPQLQVGMKATIQRRLNFRSSPGIMNNWVLTSNPGTQVEVVGGPTCTRYQNGVAYLWWQIKLPNGSVGWSAEASAYGYVYFMEPVK